MTGKARLRICGKGAELPAALAMIALLCGSGVANSASAAELSADGQAWLRTTVSAGNLPDLRWPDFSDYSKHVQKFYEFNAYSLWWVKGMEPTPQARQAIALLLEADRKGLFADDYDGPRWSARLTKLKPAAQQPVEGDALKFDLELTVCMMRYVSDLHIGKVNPKHFAFALDEESRKYDLAEFLKEHVVNGGDVAAALAQVEPPYPGYKRTLQALQTTRRLRAKMM